MNKLNDLLDGKIGRVVDVNSEWEGEEFFGGEDDWVIIEGKKKYIGGEVGNIDDFWDDGIEKDLVLFREDGYRDVCCYNGVVKKDNKWYWLDIMNEYMVYEINEID